MYYALFGVTWAIAGALGPIIGGALTTKVTWRWCFYLNCELLPASDPSSHSDSVHPHMVALD